MTVLPTPPPSSSGKHTSTLNARRPLWMLGLLLCWALLGNLTACGDDDTPGCERDSDCRGSRVCEAGQCVEDSGSTSETSTTSDTSSTTTSTTIVEPECVNDGQCDAGEICVENACVARPCSGDADCGSSDLFCYNDICQPRIACEEDSDCAAINGVCLDAQCVPPCVINADCPDPQNQVCVESICRANCGADSDCERGEICEDSYCQEPQCVGTGTEGCPDGERCANGRCIEFDPCNTDDECDPSQFCDEGICEDRTPCLGDGQCAADEQCLDGFCYPEVACEERGDCANGFDCVSGRCVPFACRGAVDCNEGEVCESGTCVEVDQQASVSRVAILTPAQSIVPGQEIPFTAVVFDEDGDIIPGYAVQWAASEPSSADINADTGVALGGDVEGTSSIVAVADGVQSPAVDLTNLGLHDIDQGTRRITVIDATTGTPVSGATVDYGEGVDPQQTDAQGRAEFPTTDAPRTITVYSDNYNYVTLVNITSADLIVPLPPASGDREVGGFTGQLDYSQVTSSGDINVGLAGASLDGELSNLNLSSILGDGFQTRIQIPGLIDQALPLPGGLVLYGSVFGFDLDIKQTYYTRSDQGLKVGWSFGGLIDAGEAFALVQGGNTDNIIAQILPFFENFEHGVEPIDIESRPLVADGDDINGNGDTAELVPDYDNFPTYDLQPNTRQRLRTGLSFPSLPSFPSGSDPFIITVGGVLTDGIGFVPQGINVANDQDGDGAPDPITLRMAPPHSGLSAGAYAVVGLTFDSSQLQVDIANGLSLPDDLSTLYWSGPNIPNDLPFDDDFLPLPQGTWDGPARSFSGQNTSGATLYRVTFINDDASWVVWTSSDSLSFTLPAPPDGFSDWSASSSVRVEAFLTRDGATLDSLASANASRLNQLNTQTRGFSRAIIRE